MEELIVLECPNCLSSFGYVPKPPANGNFKGTFCPYCNYKFPPRKPGIIAFKEPWEILEDQLLKDLEEIEKSFPF